MEHIKVPEILNSIIIPVFGNEKFLQNLLSTLLPTIDDKCEVIIIDDGFDQMKIDPLKLPSKVKYFSNPINKGYSNTVNRGIKEACGYYITTINSDILLDSNWLVQTRNTFDNYENVGLVGARLVYPSNGRVQSSGKIHNGDHIISMFRMRRPSELSNEIYKVQTVSDALATMPKHIVEEIGLYDSDFVNAYDDLDLCLRIRQAGYEILCNPLIVGYHHTSSSMEYRYAKENQSANLFFSRWRTTFNDDLIQYYQPVLSGFLSKGHKMPSQVFIINLCRKTKSEIIDIFEQVSKITILQRYDYSESLKNIPLYEQKIDIDLLKVLPYSMLLINLPIVYIVDSFIQLRDNYYWSLKRNNPLDIVFDSNFNMYMLKEIINYD